MAGIELTQAYILHSRPYRETSSLLDVFTHDYGRFSVIARGARRPKSKQRGLLQPFMCVLLSTVGKSELQTLTHIEAALAPLNMTGSKIISGLYVNEILQRLLPLYDALPDLYHAYHHCLRELTLTEQPEVILRQFELRLLSELGYAIDFNFASNGQAIMREKNYGYSLEQGFYLQPHDNPGFKGETLLALGSDAWDNPECLRSAKRLTRLAIASLIGHKPLKSRACYFREATHDK